MKNIQQLGISPAPWKARNDEIQTVEDHDKISIADAWPCGCEAANARLIAAAPMLYEALRQLVNYLSLNNWTDRELDPFVEAARAALAAASGERLDSPTAGRAECAETAEPTDANLRPEVTR